MATTASTGTTTAMKTTAAAKTGRPQATPMDLAAPVACRWPDSATGRGGGMAARLRQLDERQITGGSRRRRPRRRLERLEHWVWHVEKGYILGDQALFVGTHGSKCVPAKECGGIQEDSIYFMCDYYLPYDADDPLVYSSIYNMKNGMITPLLQGIISQRLPPRGKGRLTRLFLADVPIWMALSDIVSLGFFVCTCNM
uniref:KIB1-4 beta-propeller domain-containing protein n=1 Tax=Leersia perrieri TaxID=77586 RepID=A0A0D9X4V5_9ORYZ